MRRESVILLDDLDGGPADESVEFSVNGQGYIIDLSSGHAADFRQALAGYMEYARKAPANGTRRKPQRTQAAREHTAGIREWARAHGHTVSARGRIPREIQSAYAADKAPATVPARGSQRAGAGRGAGRRATGNARAASSVPAAPVHAPGAPADAGRKPGRKPGPKPGAKRVKR